MNAQQLSLRPDLESFLILNTQNAFIDVGKIGEQFTTIDYTWSVDWSFVFKNRTILNPQDEVYLCEHSFTGDKFTGIAGTADEPITAGLLFNTGQFCNFLVDISFADSGGYGGFIQNNQAYVGFPTLSTKIVNSISMSSSGSLSWLSVGNNIFGGFRTAAAKSFVARAPQQRNQVTIRNIASDPDYNAEPDYNPDEFNQIVSGTHVIKFTMLH